MQQSLGFRKGSDYIQGVAASKSLEFIIRQECLPLRDCMLTVTDVNGEAGFLYFKSGELIEANYAALWGKEALAQVSAWELNEHTLAPLPLGIKRSLWDPIDSLLSPTNAFSSGSLPTSNTRKFNPVIRKRTAAQTTLDKYKKIPDLYRIVSIHEGKTTIVFESAAKSDANEDITWLREYVNRVVIIGESLGFGLTSGWSILTDKYQIVGLREELSYLVFLRRADLGHDDLLLDVNLASKQE